MTLVPAPCASTLARYSPTSSGPPPQLPVTTVVTPWAR